MLGAKLSLVIGAIGLLFGAFSFGLGGHSAADDQRPQPAPAQKPDVAPAGSESLVVAGGCFWCLESLYDDLKGVYFVESGYAGGRQAGVSYEEVCTGQTGHAEAVKIVFDPKKVSPEDLLRLFFVTHNPTTLNQQGPDHGTQYRSAVFYTTEDERVRAEKIRNEIELQKIWKDPIVTTIEPLKNYTRAEEYHQNYFVKYQRATPAQRMTMNAGYCNAIIAPKVAEFRRKFADRLKRD